MSKLKEIGNKLFKEEKVELSSQEVGLGLHDDMLKWEKRGDDLLSDVKDRINKIEVSLKAVKHNYSVSENIVKEALEMAKELGASDLIALYKKRESSVKTGIKSVDKLLSKLK